MAIAGDGKDRTVAGWDIGGAHLKAARVEAGAVAAVRQIACPLWLGEERLARAFADAGEGFLGAAQHAVTMTGELAENFPSRAEGVRRIVELCLAHLRGEVRFYSLSGFVDRAVAIQSWEAVASANWHATATAVAARLPDTLLVDIGSTTADLIPIAGARVAARGTTDAERLASGELVYTGAIRTSLMALAGDAPFGGRWQPLMAENFATAADIFRLSGELDESDDLYPASDGRGKSLPECRARLARMLGRDAAEAPAEAWDELAKFFAERQLRLLHDAAFQIASAARAPAEAPLTGAGAGHFCARALAARLGRPYRDFGDIIPVCAEARRMARVCAPAAAVALLANAAQAEGAASPGNLTSPRSRRL